MDAKTRAFGRALRALRPNGIFSFPEPDLAKVTWGDCRPVSQEELDAEMARHLKECQLKECHEQRKKDYPSIEEQLDDLYHQGAFSPAMMARIREVKTKYPKP